jgi:HTH-type transcriptional regulator / antitoxin HigA
MTGVCRCPGTIFQAEEGAPQADERDALVTLIEAYEHQHYEFGRLDPAEAIKFWMEQQGPRSRDLEPYIGQSGRVSEVLNRKRPLSLRMVKRLHDGQRKATAPRSPQTGWMACDGQ